MKNYKKIDEITFEVSEVKELKDTINVPAQLELLAQQMWRIKSLVWQAKQSKEIINKTVERYNTRVDILNTAKSECHLAMKELEKIELLEDFVVENIDVEKLPKIDIHRDE